jgi:hypothetical protein
MLAHPLRALLAFLAVAATACHGPHPLPPHGPGPVSDAERNAAMISIRAHARWPEADADGVFLSLREAVAILNRDEGRAARSRRRRAIATLVAWAAGRGELLDAAASLFGAGRAELLHALDIPVPPPPPPVLEVLLVNQPALAAITVDCVWRATRPTGGVFDAPAVGYSYDTMIPRPMPDVALALDPQSWQQCSTFFRASHFVATKAACCPPSDDGCTPQQDTAGNALAAPAAARGKPYGSTALLEDFCVGTGCGACDTAPCDIDFVNVMCVDTRYDPAVHLSCFTGCSDRYEVGYRLGLSVRGEVLGVEKQRLLGDAGVVSAARVDAAEAAALGPGDWSKVHVDKTLVFDGSGFDGATRRYLSASEQELQDQIVEQACCEVEPECWIAP